MTDRRFEDEIDPVIEDFEEDKMRAALGGNGAEDIATSQPRLNPSARATAEGPEDEENMYGNDAVGPNLGVELEEQLELDTAPDLVDEEAPEPRRPFPDDRV